MSDKKDDDFTTDDKSGYKVSEKVTRDELLAKDSDDKSLQAYKEKLLGKGVIIDPDNPSNVILNRFAVTVPNDKGEYEEKYAFDASEKNISFILKEGASYKVRLEFQVQRDMVSALKYINPVYRKGLKVDSTVEVVGSYAPDDKKITWDSEEAEAPKGMLARGHYTAKTRLTDDDKNIYAELEYNFDIAKDWTK